MRWYNWLENSGKYIFLRTHGTVNHHWAIILKQLTVQWFITVRLPFIVHSLPSWVKPRLPTSTVIESPFRKFPLPINGLLFLPCLSKYLPWCLFGCLSSLAQQQQQPRSWLPRGFASPVRFCCCCCCCCCCGCCSCCCCFSHAVDRCSRRKQVPEKAPSCVRELLARRSWVLDLELRFAITEAGRGTSWNWRLVSWDLWHRERG